MSRPEAQTYLADKGYTMSLKQYDRIKKNIVESRHIRLSEIANTGFIDAHLEAIDTFLKIKQEMWKQYESEQHPYKKTEILTQIANLQPYINEYYSSTQDVMISKTKQQLENKDNNSNITK